MTERTYRVYMIKCKTTNEVYIGRTESSNEKYNPISVLYKRYKQDKSKYTKLGEAIAKHKYANFAFTFVKEGLNSDESDELIESTREKIKDRSLHDDPIDTQELFKDDLALFI
jgi:hypothetical protein